MAEVKRRMVLRLRFSLWAMLVLITVVAIPLSYVAQRRSFNLRRAAAWEIVEKKELSAYDPTVHQASIDETTLLNWFRRNVLLEDSTHFLTILHVAHPGSAAMRPINILESDQYKITDQDLEQLGCFPEIREVLIRDGDLISDDGLQFLGRLPNLRELWIEDAPQVRGKFLPTLAKANQLQALSLTGMRSLEAENLIHMGLLTRLKDLRLSDCPRLNDDALREVSLPSDIKNLVLSELSIRDETVARWLKQTRLKTLELDADISEISVSEIAQHLELESLRITNAPLSDSQFAFLGSLPKLKTLGLVGMPIDGAFLKQFPNSPPLQSLSLASTLLSDGNACELKRFAALRSVDLGWTAIDGSSIECLLNSGIERLWLPGTRLSEAGKDALVKLNGLSSLHLPGNWEVEDYQRYKGHEPPKLLQVSSAQYDRARELSKSFSLWSGRGAAEMDSIDRAPAGLMAPVIRLRELAKADKE